VLQGKGVGGEGSDGRQRQGENRKSTGHRMLSECHRQSRPPLLVPKLCLGRRVGIDSRKIDRYCKAPDRPAPARKAVKRLPVRITDVTFGYEDHLYRTPIKFGGVALDRVTLLNANCSVRSGRDVARGFGSMPLGNVWSFPSRVLTYGDTLAAMKALAERVARIFGDCTEVGHPIDLAHSLEPVIRRAADDTSSALRLAQPMPWLAALVVASPFDAALHDGFGKVH